MHLSALAVRASGLPVHDDRFIGRRGLAAATEATPPAVAPTTERERSEGGKPDAYAAIRDFAHVKLKGQERAVIEALCDAGGELLINDLAVAEGVDWDDPSGGYKSVQRRLNPKLKPLRWRIERRNNAACFAKIGR